MTDTTATTGEVEGAGTGDGRDRHASPDHLQEDGWVEVFGEEGGTPSVGSHNLKINGTVVKGYRLDGPDGLGDAFRRYLPPLAATSATNATSQVTGVADAATHPLPAATARPEPP